jgi:uncharacterized RDD family membrane protein YckC
MNYAGFWIRFWAAFVDGLCFYLLSIAEIALLASGQGWFYFVTPHPGLALVNTALNWVFFALFESGGWQATPGKRLMGLRVTDLNGDRLSFGRATGRYFAKILSGLLFCIGYIMVGVTAKKQGLHDRLAETLVLHGKAGEEDSEPSSRSEAASPQRNDNFVVRSANSKKWVMAGFDENGHVVRLSFREDDGKLRGAGLIIGRHAKSCDLVIADTSISRQHARLFDKNGSIWIEDLGSTNGVTVDGRTLRANTSVMLPDEGRLVLGSVELSIGKS